MMTSTRSVPSTNHGSPSFPQRKAFVLQFEAEAGPQSGLFTGRVEHVLSGDQAQFESTEELWAFVRKMLVQPEKQPALPAGRRLRST